MPRKFTGSGAWGAAQRYVYRCLQATIVHDIGQGSGYLFDDLEDDRDRKIVLAAAHHIAKILKRRGGAPGRESDGG